MRTATAPAPAQADLLDPLRRFVRGIEGLVDAGAGEPALLREAADLLARLVAQDNWLPEPHARPDPMRYRQYLLYRDPAARFSVVSFVWAPGQRTPVHDHTVWGLVGVLRGAETAHRYVRRPGRLERIASERLAAGSVDILSPAQGDIHLVENAVDAVTVSIHVYGADIGAVQRSTYAPDGTATPFVSVYADAPALQLWSA